MDGEIEEEDEGETWGSIRSPQIDIDNERPVPKKGGVLLAPNSAAGHTIISNRSINSPIRSVQH
jgi:hypothetical protein